MTAPETAETNTDSVPPIYEAYAQLVKMLLPSSGCLAIYALDGDLSWSSEGFERPDFRELVDDFRSRNQGLPANQGVIRETSAGATALIAHLGDAQGEPLGFALIELGRTQSNAGKSMAASMTRPLMSCLASELASDARGHEPPQEPEAKPQTSAKDRRLGFLFGLSEIDLNGSDAIRNLLAHCVQDLDCMSAVFCVPELDLTEFADRSNDAETRSQLDATRKHLLAWVQLNNKPMVVNRVDAEKSPYKILSCPVIDRDLKPKGLIALFRGSDGRDFDLDDVRLLEFLSREGMLILADRQDPLSGLMSRTAFERLLDERLRSKRAATGGALLYLDIDNLKAVNATFGMRAGDEAILRTAQLIRRLLTPGEIPCRLAADRFVIYLPERDKDGAETLGAELVNSAKALGYASGGQQTPISLRCGAAQAPTGATPARHWIAAAELACQQARLEHPAEAQPLPAAQRGAG